MLRHGETGAVIASHVEVMSSARARARGLLKFKEAPPDYAGVFEMPWGGFCPAIHTFGMCFAIDIIFCDAHRRIRALYRGVKPGRLVLPLRYIAGGLLYVIEWPASADTLCVGDSLEWSPS